MARRSKDWNVGLAQDLRDPNFAREFLLAAIEEGVSIQIALGKVIRAIGIKEFSVEASLGSGLSIDLSANFRICSAAWPGNRGSNSKARFTT